VIEPLLYELHDMARERGIEGYRRMSKTELLEVVGDGQHVGGPTTVERSVRRGLGLLTLICLGNLANLSFLSPAIPGPEEYLAGRPLLLVTVIFVQIVVTLVLVGMLAPDDPASTARRLSPVLAR